MPIRFGDGGIIAPPVSDVLLNIAHIGRI